MDLLFVTHDPGETLAFLPLFPHLQERGVEFGVLPLGLSAAMLPPATPLVHQWDEGGEPFLVVTGTVSHSQHQVLDGIKEGRTKKVGYVDGVHRLSPQCVEWTFLPKVDEMWVSCEAVKKSLGSHGERAQVRVVGQPSIERWRRAHCDPLVRDWFRKTFHPDRPVVLYASGYGEDFESSFRFFLQAVREVEEAQFCISLHPKGTGEQERQLLHEVGLGHVAVAPKGFSTQQLSTLSQLLICYRSTAGFQALFQGIPVIYAFSGEVPFTNLALEEGLVEQAREKDELVEKVRQVLQSPTGALHATEVCARLGFPLQSEGLFVEELLRACSHGRRAQWSAFAGKEGVK